VNLINIRRRKELLLIDDFKKSSAEFIKGALSAN